MIQIPHVYIPILATPLRRTVQRLIVAHPKSVQYIQHDGDAAEMCIRYVSGEQVVIRDVKDPEYVKKMFEDFVYQIKDSANFS